MCVCLYSVPRLLGGHALHGEIPGLAKDVTGQIVSALLLYQLTHVASQSALIGTGMIAGHRELQDIPTDYKESIEIVSIKELPGSLTPLGMSMLTYQFGYLEILM